MKKNIIQPLVFFIGIFSSTLITATSLSSIESQLQNYVITHQADELSLLTTLVNINSGTENIQGVHKVGKILQKQFEQLGFTTHWTKEPTSMHRAGTLTAEIKGKQGKRLLLIGHLDTVFSPKSPFKQFKRHGNLASGPGVSDDKGGDMVILYALKALAHYKLLDQTNITIVLTGDEEESGKPASISRKPLFEAARNKDIALDFEPGGSIDRASIDRRGISNWTLVSSGREGHSSAIFKSPIGYGAIFEQSRILNSAREQLAQEQYLSFNPSLILGGTKVSYHPSTATGSASGKHNVVAQTATAQGDLRYISVEQKKKAEEKIRAIVAQHLLQTNATINFVDGIPPMPPTENNKALLQQYSQASIDLGYGVIEAAELGSRGAGDISYIAAQVPANLVGLGPVGSGQHSSQETLDIRSLEVNTARAALLIYRLTR